MRPEIIERWQPKDIAESYEAEQFSGWVGRLFHRRQTTALRRIIRRIAPGGRVMDIPCGTGRMLPVWLTEGCRVVACDVSASMLGQARKRCRPGDAVSYLLGDASRLPFESDSLDAVISVRFFMHLTPEERRTILKEFSRVSRRWVVVEYGRDSPWHHLRRRLRDRLLLWLRRPRIYPPSAAEGLIRSEIEQAGLRVRDRVCTLRGLSESVFFVSEKVAPATENPTDLERVKATR